MLASRKFYVYMTQQAFTALSFCCFVPLTPCHANPQAQSIVREVVYLVGASKISEVPVDEFTANLCFRNVDEILLDVSIAQQNQP